MNEKWIVLCCTDYDRIWSIEKTRLFCGDQDQVAVEAQQVNRKLPQDPWQLVNLNDIDSATLEPGTSNRMAVRLEKCRIFQILNLATGETVCRVFFGSNLFPISWLAGNFLLIKELQLNSDNGKSFQVVIFDPSRSRGYKSVEELKKEEACLLFGPIVNYSGATKISVNYLQILISMIHMDFFGLVCAVPPTLFIASFD
jgi:hypothetical protein